MNDAMLKQYSILVEFLGKALGPDYEVALYDIGTENNSIVAIANGYISGRTVGAPMTNMGLNIISNKLYKHSNYKLHYHGVSKDQRVLRSSTMFIKDENEELAAMLCISFDDRRFANISNEILKLCHPDELVDQHCTYESINSLSDDEVETFSGSVSEVTETVLNKVLANKNIPIDRLTQDERLDVIEILIQKGVFMLKGAVSEVAKQLHCSEPTVYRYINKLNKD